MSVQMQPADITEQGMKLVEDAGFGMIRKGVYWNSIEKTKGVYDFSSYDAMFADAKAHNMFVSATLYGNNSLYEAGTTGVITAAGRAGFAKFAAAAAAHYADYDVVWEIWNEPNLTSFWHTPSNSDAIADEYTALVIATAPAIKQANPLAFVVAGSISALWSQSFAWFDECIAKGILTSGIDGISVHPYGFAWPELTMTSGYDVIRDTMDAAGAAQLRLVTTEVGYDTDWIQERQGYTAEEAREVQAWLFVREQLVDQLCDLGYSNWYEFREGKIWGLVDTDFNPYPSYTAAQVYARELGDYTFVKTLSTESSLDFVALFANDAGAQKVVAWTTASLSDPAASRIAHPHAITIPVAVDGVVSIVDVDGKASSITTSGGNLTLEVTGGPQYIVLPQSAPTSAADPGDTETPPVSDSDDPAGSNDSDALSGALPADSDFSRAVSGGCAASGATSELALAVALLACGRLARIGHTVASRGGKAGRRSRRHGGKRDEGILAVC